VLTILIGALVGSTIVAFLAFTDWMHALLFGKAMPVVLRPLTPAAAALIAGYLLLRVFPNARGSGIPQTKAALIAGGGHIDLKTVIGKFFCCSLSLGGGVALGREGPAVQIGAGVASCLARRARLEKREVQAMVPIGAAAALAAAFNTPMAAVLFTLEELLGDLNARLLGSVVIGAATSWMVLHLFLGDAPLFRVPPYSLVHPSEFLFYAVLGIAGGCVSVLFSSSLLWLRLKYRRLPKWTLAFQPATGGLAAGVLALYSADVLGAGYAAFELALHGQLSGTSMFILLLLKLAATVICYSSGNAGGIFGPSLFLGAMLGGGFGSLLHTWLPVTTGTAGLRAGRDGHHVCGCDSQPDHVGSDDLRVDAGLQHYCSAHDLESGRLCGPEGLLPHAHLRGAGYSGRRASTPSQRATPGGGHAGRRRHAQSGSVAQSRYVDCCRASVDTGRRRSDW
jgi:CIC family chloride channel protein